MEKINDKKPVEDNPLSVFFCVDFETDAITINVYPVGSIYMSTVDVDPSTLFGGTWERIKDTFLLCAGDNYEAGSVGGSETHTHSNPSTGSTAITVAQMPSHSHSGTTHTIGPVYRSYNIGDWNGNSWVSRTQGAEGISGGGTCQWAGYSWTDSVANTGSGEGHSHTVGDTSSSSNMPPYLTVYCWRRTA